MNCRICGNNTGNTCYTALEMYYGTREPFEYMECKDCGCVQIVNVPEDMASHYPSDYYTAQKSVEYDFSSYNKSDIEQYINNVAVRYFSFLGNCGIKTLDYSILDIGCGNGGTIRGLASMGFKRTVGVDMFLHPQHAYEDKGCRVYQGDFYDITEKFDFIYFQDSFEHLDKHRDVLLKVNEILNVGGICWLVIPVAGYPWHHYGVNWYGLDAPRHFTLHSRKSISMLLDQTGFHLKSFKATSNSAQFIISEMYKRGIPYVQYGHAAGNLPQKELDFYSKLSDKLNERNIGDRLELHIVRK